jgi:hypothetical protein
MNWKLMALGWTGVAIAFIPFLPVNANQGVRFSCDRSLDPKSQEQLPTTVAFTQRGKIALIRWKTESFPGFPPQKRCDEVTPRFQRSYDNKTLRFLTNGRVNNQPVICAVEQRSAPCQDSNLLMTLRQGDNPYKILAQFRDVLNGRSAGPVVHSSGVPQVYYQVDIDNLLETAPVEQK